MVVAEERGWEPKARNTTENLAIIDNGQDS
jgi:hypothetical protein